MAEQLGPNAQLPTMVQLRESLGVSMNTLNAALRELEKQQVLRSVHGVGIFVQESQRHSLTGNIGLLLHSAYLTPSYNSAYMQTVLGGIREGSNEQGMKIVLLEDDDAINLEEIDGILFYSDKLEVYAMGIPPEIPQVMIFQHTNDITTVTADDFGGSKLATSYLIQHGHRRIACLMEELMDIPIQRRGGYQAALQEAGIAVQSDWLRLTEKMRPSKTANYLEWGRHHMRAWLDEGWRDLNCTAIVAQNDLSAIGIIQILQEAGIDVPGQVSVIGFDGTNVGDLVRPRLTSIEVPLRQIGQEAIKVLCGQIKNGQQAPHEISLPVKLRKGGSVAQINLKGE